MTTMSVQKIRVLGSVSSCTYSTRSSGTVYICIRELVCVYSIGEPVGALALYCVCV